MIALRKTYYGRDINPGESFEVAQEHVNILSKAKSAKLAPVVESEPDKRKYKRRDMQAED